MKRFLAGAGVVTAIVALTVSPATAVTPTTYSFASPSYLVGENAGPASINITRTGDLNTVPKVSCVFTESSATFPFDYTRTSAPALFARNSSTATCTLPVVNDHLEEGLEAVTVSLVGPAEAAAVPSVPLFISDNVTIVT